MWLVHYSILFSFISFPFNILRAEAVVVAAACLGSGPPRIWLFKAACDLNHAQGATRHHSQELLGERPPNRLASTP